MTLTEEQQAAIADAMSRLSQPSNDVAERQRLAIQQAQAALTQSTAASGDLYSRSNRDMFDAGATSQSPDAMRPVQGDPTAMSSLLDNVVGIDNGTLSAGERIAAGINNAGESLSFGLVGDEANAYADSLIGRGEYDDRLGQYRGLQEQFRQENPIASLATEVLPAMAVPGGAMMQGGGLLARMGLGALAGGAGAGTYGFMEGEGGAQNRADEAQSLGLLGAAIGGAVPVAGTAISNVWDGVVRNRALNQAVRTAPSAAELRTQGNALYRQIDDAGLQVRPEAFARLRDDMVNAARSSGLDELPGNPNTPRAARNIQRADEMIGAMASDETSALPFESLDQFRRSIGPAAGDMANNTESAIGSQMIGQLDDFVQSLGAEDVTAGDVQTVQDLIPKAREVWSRMMRSQTIDDAMEASQNYVSGDASGLRNQFGRILRNPKLTRGFSDEERALMRRVVNGSFPERLVHLLGGGLGQMASVGMGVGLGASAGPVGGLAGGVLGAGIAAGTRKASEAIAQRNANAARAAIATGTLREGAQLPMLTNQSRGLLDEMLARFGRGAAISQQ
jgi:hypothetical protein